MAVRNHDDKKLQVIQNETVKTAVSQFFQRRKSDVEVAIAREFPLTIILNDMELVTLLCTPVHLDYLAVGFLFAEGILSSKDEIKKIIVDDHRGVVRIATLNDKESLHEILFKRLITSAYGRGAAFYTTATAQNLTKLESSAEISSEEVLDLVRRFEQHCDAHKVSRGVHSAALCDAENILVFSDDLGRHNAIDKVFGECILKGIRTEDHLVITSGRTPSEIVLKVAKARIPILISLSVPTDLGMRLARGLGITIIGCVKRKSMIVYTGDRRVT